MIARSTTESISDVLDNARSTTAQYNARAIKSVLAEKRVGDYQAAVIDQWPGISDDVKGGAHSRLMLFLAGGVHFNVQYAAPSEALFEKYVDEAERALETLSPLPGKKSADAHAAEREELAWYKQYSFLLEKTGDAEGNKALAAEGLKKFPADQELQARAGIGNALLRPQYPSSRPKTLSYQVLERCGLMACTDL